MSANLQPTGFGVRSGFVIREQQQTLASPDTNQAYGCGITQVNHTKRRINDFPDAVLIEFRDLFACIRIIAQILQVFQDDIDKLLAHVRYALRHVIRLDLL